MNIRNKRIAVFIAFTRQINPIGATLCIWCGAVFLVTSYALANEETAPTLQRVMVMVENMYAFDFRVLHGVGAPLLLELGSASETDASTTERYNLFRGGNPATRRTPLRWDIAGGTFFCTYADFGANVPPFGVLRYPIADLIPGLENRWPLRTKPHPLFPVPFYTVLLPQLKLKSGIKWDENGEFRVSTEQIHEVYWDLLALDRTRIELFMTADGNLSVWVFDGHNWRLSRDNVTRIAGPFLVLREGKAILAEREGQWCVLGLLDSENPKWEPIVQKTDGVPLILVEDRVAKREYFLHGNVLLEAPGKTLLTLPADLSNTDRFVQVAREVHARRADK